MHRRTRQDHTEYPSGLTLRVAVRGNSVFWQTTECAKENMIDLSCFVSLKHTWFTSVVYQRPVSKTHACVVLLQTHCDFRHAASMNRDVHLGRSVAGFSKARIPPLRQEVPHDVACTGSRVEYESRPEFKLRLDVRRLSKIRGQQQNYNAWFVIYILDSMLPADVIVELMSEFNLRLPVVVDSDTAVKPNCLISCCMGWSVYSTQCWRN